MTFFLVHEGTRGKYNVMLQDTEIHSIIKESLGRSRNIRLGATLLNFCSFTERMSPEEYARDCMKWSIPKRCHRWLHGDY